MKTWVEFHWKGQLFFVRRESVLGVGVRRGETTLYLAGEALSVDEPIDLTKELLGIDA